MASEEEYRRDWVLELHNEHRKICWQHSIQLSVPLIEINQSHSCWGSWAPGTSTLTLSRSLIEQHSWDVVINVFKHEMAHQIVTEIFSSSEKHGELFHKACVMLGLPENFRSAGGDLPRTIPDLHAIARLNPKGKIIAKVEKLLSLAQSANEHEAQQAMKKANSLIIRHNLEQISSTRKNSFDFIIINHKKKRIENYQRRICSILSNFFFVKVIFSELYDAECRCSHKTIEHFGTRENVLMAHYVYSFLISHLSSFWEQYSKKHPATGRKKRSYWLGILDGFGRQLAQQHGQKNTTQAAEKQHGEKIQSLIALRDQQLNLFISQRYPRLTSKKVRPSRVHSQEYSDGKKDGMGLTLTKPICRQDGYCGSLLPSGNK